MRMFPFFLAEAPLETRLVAAGATAGAIVLCGGSGAIRILRRIARERVASDSKILDALHAGKSGTPTMGGLLTLTAAVSSALLFCDLADRRVQVVALVSFVLAGLGFADDYQKATTQTKGLRPRQKLVVQAVIGAVAGVLLYPVISQVQPVPWGPDVFAKQWWPGGMLYVIWSALVISTASNSVNLTDGLDGLATGSVMLTLVPVILAGSLGVVASGVVRPPTVESGEVTVLLAGVMGALGGFLWFNCCPARVFLGDTGALSLGGCIGAAALAMRVEYLVLVAGGVFAAELLSVVLQVGSFRLTGRRILRCSPLHNHFVFRGDPEPRIVMRFLLAGCAFSAAAVWLVVRGL